MNLEEQIRHQTLLMEAKRQLARTKQNYMRPFDYSYWQGRIEALEDMIVAPSKPKDSTKENCQMTKELNGLKFSVLREANLARLPQFRNKHGELAHSKPDGSDWSPAQWLQAVIGELGEYANIRKKFERGDLNELEFKELAAEELADVQTYLDLLAFQLDIDLGLATLNKWNKISERVGSPIRLEPNCWYSLYTLPPKEE